MINSRDTFNDNLLDEKCRRLTALTLDRAQEAVEAKNYEACDALSNMLAGVGTVMSNLNPED